MVDIYEVGGCVRDEILGKPTKDIDFTVVAPSLDDMRAYLESEGFTIHTETERFFTIRCGIPEGHPLRERAKDADFVWARKDGPYTDGRRPDYVEPGTIWDDLARRDFTMNAIARDIHGVLLDPHGGVEDIKAKRLKFVGNTIDRIREDGLRVIRGFRFMVTHDLNADSTTARAMISQEAAALLSTVSSERVREELNRMLRADTIKSIMLLNQLPDIHKLAIFKSPLRLEATLAQ